MNHRWQPEEIREIRARYNSVATRELAERFGVTPVQLTGIAFYYGIYSQKSKWRIKRVISEKSKLDPILLSESKRLIGEKILQETDFERAKKLETIYKEMNIAIVESL